MKKMKKQWRSLLVLVVVMSASIGVSFLLAQIFDDNNPFAVPVFILAVALVSRFSTGYLYGLIAAVLGVFCVNIIFTYPFWEFNLSISGYPLTFAVMLLVSLIISTLTTRVKQQEQLRFEAEKEKMRANLLRSISHDIRTPLTSMIGASSTLLENRALPESDREELLREIHKDAEWLVRVTENILSVTKLSGEGVVLKKSEEVVEEILSSAIVKFRKNQPELALSVRKPEEIVLAPMDATLIQQVLLNLFENVAAHGKTATAIRVSLTSESGRVVIAVADNGVGIEPHRLAHLFDGTAAQEETRLPDGRRNMGIGLSVCQAILAAHGGGITAFNNEDGGATFRFWLPQGEVTHEQSHS